jgi:hypothetical protein
VQQSCCRAVMRRDRTDLNGSWSPGRSKLRTINAKLDQEGPAQTSWVCCAADKWLLPLAQTAPAAVCLGSSSVGASHRLLLLLTW